MNGTPEDGTHTDLDVLEQDVKMLKLCLSFHLI
jgi:hypothetical protein